MIGRRQEINLQFLQIVDGILLVLAFWLAYVLRHTATGWFGLFAGPIPKFDEYRWLMFIIMPFGPILLELQKFYIQPLQKSFFQSFGQVLRAGGWLTLTILCCVLLFKLNVPNRMVMILFVGIAASLVLLREQLTILFIRTKARSENYREPVLLAGTPGDVQMLLSHFPPDLLMEMEIKGEIDFEKHNNEHFIDLLHRHSISRVIFAGNHSHIHRLQEAINACEVEGVEAWLAADFIKTAIARPSFDILGSQPMIVFRSTPEVSWSYILKMLIDRVGSFCLLVAASPLLLVVAALVRFSSAGPVIFTQQRGGKYGKPFTMYKFRTMAADAETRRAELAEHNEMSGPVFKITDDPRITRFGRWLRKTSIDELPQLFNVLKGEMSLVGPRPLPLYEVERIENSAQRRRLSVKPGLTCLWQISGRNNLQCFEQWVQLDLDYIDNWSIWLDFKILLKTIPVVLFGSGAK